MNPRGNSKEHILYFFDKILKGEKFGIVRPADGEFQVLCDQTLTNCDNWTYRQGGRLRNDMFVSLSKELPNLFIGIPCETCNQSMKETYESILGLPKNRRTYSNLFCNANWKTFITFLRNYPDGFLVVTSGTQKTDLPIKDTYTIDEFLVNEWDTKYQQETERIMNWIKTKINEVICFSAGPLSKVWIPIAMELNPTNVYLDVGSALDLFTKGKTNRYYTKEGDGLETLVCSFQD